MLALMEDMSAEQINREFQKIIAEAENGVAPALDEDVWKHIVEQLRGRPRRFTFVDLFCGAGGSSIGFTLAGGLLKLAANHSRRAIETHGSNFRDADHRCVDINHYDMRNLPHADVLWGSPICTELSPAGGNTADEPLNAQEQLEFEGLQKEGPVSVDTYVRTRATFHDIVRATEARRFKYVVVENVVEAAIKWKLFGWWLDGMRFLGYRHQIICVSSAHIGGPLNPWAPQRRDRMYVVFSREDMPAPALEPRPTSMCATCGIVDGFQSWKKPNGRMTKSGRIFKVGKYGIRNGQYVYRCPNGKCRNSVVTPLERPAAAVIDWSDLGVPIGERPDNDPLSPATIRRIERGLELFANPARPWLDANGGSWNTNPEEVARAFRSRTTREWEALVTPGVLVNSAHDDDRSYPVHGAALPAATQKIGFGVATPPAGAFYTKNYSGRPEDRVRAVSEPFGAMTTGRNHGIVVPPGAFVETHRQNVVPTSAYEPLTTISAGGNHHGLVVPYYRTGKASSTDMVMPAVTTKDRCGFVPFDGEVISDVKLCRYRMIQWHEQARAQRFPGSYLLTGNNGERTAQAGNAVSVNVAMWIGEAIADAMNQTAAAGY